MLKCWAQIIRLLRSNWNKGHSNTVLLLANSADSSTKKKKKKKTYKVDEIHSFAGRKERKKVWSFATPYTFYVLYGSKTLTPWNRWKYISVKQRCYTFEKNGTYCDIVRPVTRHLSMMMLSTCCHFWQGRGSDAIPEKITQRKVN